MKAAHTILFIVFLWLLSLTAQAQNLDTILARLGSASAKERVSALRQLAKRPAEWHALKPLTKALRDPSPNVRQEALNTWSLVGEAYNKVVWRAHRARPQFTAERRAAEQKAYGDWHTEVVKAIGTCTHDRSQRVRLEAARTLARLGDSIRYIFPPYSTRCPPGTFWPLSYVVDDYLHDMAKQQPAILHILVREKEPQVVYRAAASLAMAGNPKIQPVLKAFLLHADPVWRMIGCATLSYQGTDADILPLLADRDDRVRQCTTRHLHKHYEALQNLAASFPRMNALQKRSFLLLHHWALSEPGYPDLIRAACYDKDPDVVADAVKMTEYPPWRLPDDTYVQSLLRHPHPRVRASAASVLKRYHEKEALALLIPMLEDPDATVREAIVELAGGQKDARLPVALVASLRYNKEDVSDTFVWTMAGNWRYAEPLVLEMRKNEDWRQRALAVRTIGFVNHPKTAELIADLARDTNPKVRQAVARSLLQKQGTPSSVILMGLLADKDKEVYLEALYALGVPKDAGTRAQIYPILQRLCQSSDVKIVEAAREARDSFDDYVDQ
jgi:HEAT repeat protein